MQLQILAFGIAKDIIGGSSLTVELPESTTLSDLKAHITQQFPEMEKLTSLLIAVNNEYGQPHKVLRSNDEIALIPPVSGG